MAHLAARQHGVVSLEQLRGDGFSDRAVSRLVATGSLHRLYRGVFAVGHRRLSKRGRWIAGVFALGPAALLSHRSCAELRGFVRRSGRIEVTVPRQIRARRGITPYVCTDLTAADRTLVDAIPCASVPLTLLGLAATDASALPGALATAEKRGVLDLAAIDELLARRSRTPGGPALRAALGAYRSEWTWTRSELERRFLGVCVDARVPRPRVNAWIEVPGDGFEVDFSWPQPRLIVETDGHARHGDRHVFEEDRRRDQQLVAAGWRVVRFTWRQVVHDRAEVARVLRRLLSSPSARA